MSLIFLTVIGVPTPGAALVADWVSLSVRAEWPEPDDAVGGTRPVSPSVATYNAGRTVLVVVGGAAFKVPQGVLVRFAVVGIDASGTNYDATWTQQCHETAPGSGLFDIRA